MTSHPHLNAPGMFLCILHRVVAVLIEAANLLRLFRPLRLSVHGRILRAVVRFDGQNTIGPSLPLAPEPVRGLHQS